MDDLISRQAAIDLTIGLSNDSVDFVRAGIKALPPAQPEVVRCRDCRFYTEDKWGDEIGYPGLIVAHEICEKWGNGCKTSEDGYCFLGERKEKDNG